MIFLQIVIVTSTSCSLQFPSVGSRLITQLHWSFDSGIDMHFDMQDKTQSPRKRVRSLSKITLIVWRRMIWTNLSVTGKKRHCSCGCHVCRAKELNVNKSWT